MASGARIDVSARQQGNAGTAVVWANELTVYAGTIYATGGALGGDGGFVEVSGKDTLVFRGGVDASAVAGQLGTLLLDPQEGVLQGGTGDGTADANASTSSFGGATVGSVLFGEFGPSVTIRESEIESLDAHIVIEAQHNIRATGTFSNNRLDPVSGRSLTLRTRNSPGDEAGSAQAAGIHLGTLQLRTQGGGALTLLTGTGGPGGRAAGITTGALTTIGGAITVNSGNGGAISVGDLNSAGGVGARPGAAIVVSSTGNVTLGTVTSSAGAAINNQAGHNAGSISLSGGDLTVAAILAEGGAPFGTGTGGGAGGAVTLAASDGTPIITLNGDVSTIGGNATAGGTSGAGGNLTVTGGLRFAAARSLTTSGGTGGTAGAAGSVTLGAVDSASAATQNFTVTAGTGSQRGDIIVFGPIGATFALNNLTLAGNDLTIGSIGGANAGVLGTTAVTAASVGADNGTIAFAGTVYNTNLASYVATAGNTLLLNAPGTTQFLSSNDALTFGNAGDAAGGTLVLGNGANLSVGTGTGAINAFSGIRGHSGETLSLIGGNILVGQIGAGEEIGGVAITGSAITLRGDLNLADVAGNNVTLNGPVTLANAVSILANRAVNDGNVTITGPVTSTGLAFQVTGGALSLGDITTTGGSAQDGGAVTLIGSGAVTAGATTTSGGTAGANQNGRNAGSVTVSGADVTAGTINARGSSRSGTATSGGNGGAVSLTATDGTPTVLLAGNIITTGGNATAGGTSGAGGNVNIAGSLRLDANRSISTGSGTGGTQGPDGNVTLGSVANANATAHGLTITADTGSVNVAGNVGALGAALEGLTLGSAGLASFNGNVFANTLTASAAVGNLAFLNGFTVNSLSLANTGTLQLGDAPGDVTRIATGGFAPTVATSLAGTLTVNAGGVAFGPLTLLSDVTIDTSAGNGAIAFTGAVAGAARNLTLTAGTGALASSGANNLTLAGLTLQSGSATAAAATGRGAAGRAAAGRTAASRAAAGRAAADRGRRPAADSPCCRRRPNSCRGRRHAGFQQHRHPTDPADAERAAAVDATRSHAVDAGRCQLHHRRTAG